MIWVEPARPEEALTRGGHLYHPEDFALQVPPKRGNDVFRVDTDHGAKLAMRRGARRNRVHRALRIAGDEREHLEARPAEHALGGRQGRLTPALRPLHPEIRQSFPD